MLPADIERHLDTVRELSKPGQVLSAGGPTATVNNPEWFKRSAGRRVTRLEREELHQRLLQKRRDTAPDVEAGKRAIVLAGPPGAGKSTVLNAMLWEQGGDRAKWLTIDADDFKRDLLTEAVADGSYESWIKPPEVTELEAVGERFFPLELAALVHEESSVLAKQLRTAAIEEGLNVVIDTVLSDEQSALELGRLLAANGYVVRVIDVEVPFEVSAERIHDRWMKSYSEALEGKDPLGGRWVPSEYARSVFAGPDGRSVSEGIALRLATDCPVVSGYQLHRTTAAMAAVEKFPTPLLEQDQRRLKPGLALVDRAVAETHARVAKTRPTTARSVVEDFER